MMATHEESGGLLGMAANIVDSIGLRRSRVGRKLIAGLNVVGQQGARLLYLRGNTPLLIDGHRMFLSDRHAPSLGFVSSMVHDRYETEMKDLLCGLIRKGMTVFDVGAHVGHYTLMAARNVGPHGHVYAFEPEPENYAILRKNVELNGYKNVTCIPKAVADRNGVIPLYVSRQGNDRHTVIDDPRAVSLSIKREVPMTTLDEFASSLGWPRVDLIKMDVEGAEPKAIAGLTELLARSNALSLVIEFAPEILRAGGTDPIKFLGTLRDLGLTIAPVDADISEEALEAPNLWRSMAEIERRGAINVVCKKYSF